MRSLTFKKEQNGALLAFFYSALAALFIFLPFVIVDGGLFHYCGDFNSQQIPFYYYMNDFVKSGGGWSWESDLGGSAVNTYAFYLYGSPFFWLSTIFPAAWLPFLMPVLLVFKFGVSGLGAYMYLARYAKTRNFCVLAACLYALSGFTVYNVFFNHFVDCVALFPFLLWSLDEFVYEKRFGVFAAMVAINCINNYFFFAGQIVFLLIYFVVKLLTREYRITLPRFGRLAFESVLGVAMGCALLIPAMLCLKDNPRTVDLSSGFGFLMYSKVQQYFAIFTSFFLPPDPPYIPSIYTEGVIKWTSMSAFLPVVSCVGVLCYLRAHKKSALTRILWICVVMAFVPALNSSFYMLNSSYYARWFYMPILLMCAATMHSLEDDSADWNGALRTVALITFSFIVFALVPKKDGDTWSFGVAENPDQFLVQWLLALLGLVLFLTVLRFARGKPYFARRMLATVLAFSVAYSIVHIAIGKFGQWDNDADYRAETYDAARNIDWPEDARWYRIDAYECYDNIGLWTGKSCLQFFNSVVTPSIMEFYPSVGVKRDVSSKPEHDKYALRGLLGVKYTLVPADKTQEFEEEVDGRGWTRAFSSEPYVIYENTNYVGMAYAYDNFISLEGLANMDEEKRPNVLMRAIGLSSEQIQKYLPYIYPVSGDDLENMDYHTYVQDIAARRAMSADSFDARRDGFTATITLERDNLVLLAVPYDPGFTATVNGVNAEIEKVSNGLMAVLCPAGENEIVFTYHTPGLRLSLLITLCALCVWAVYCGILYLPRKKTKHRRHYK